MSRCERCHKEIHYRAYSIGCATKYAIGVGCDCGPTVVDSVCDSWPEAHRALVIKHGGPVCLSCGDPIKYVIEDCQGKYFVSADCTCDMIGISDLIDTREQAEAWIEQHRKEFISRL